MPFNHYFDIVQTHKMRLSSCFQSNYWIIELLGFLSSVPCCLLFIGKGECLDTLISPGAAWLCLLSTMLPPVYRKRWMSGYLNISWSCLALSLEYHAASCSAFRQVQPSQAKTLWEILCLFRYSLRIPRAVLVKPINFSQDLRKWRLFL